MKLNKKGIIILAAVAVVLILLFAFGGSGVRQTMIGIVNSLVGGETGATPTDAGLAVNDDTPTPTKTPTNTTAPTKAATATPTKAATPTPTKAATSTPTPTVSNYVTYVFRNKNLLNQHYEKHGIDMGYDSAESYQKAASDVVNNPSALHKTEAEDGDDIYYIEATNEFVVVSTDGYLRTFFLPDAGINYYNRQ